MSHESPASALPEERLTVAGLAAPVAITVDRWGIAHIEASSLDDLFFAQGFNAARDRLWQIDLWRKRGLGLLAADFGPGYLAQDRAARLFLYRGDIADEWNCYAPDARAICQAFTAGINAFVALTRDEPARLSPEFALLGTEPAFWSAEDVVRIRSHGLTRNAVSEVLRANIVARSDLATDLLRRRIEPRVEPHEADGLDLSAVPLDILDVFLLATAPVTFTPERLAAGLDEAAAWSKVTDLGEVVRDASFAGSNNWAVHGSRTRTGRPILASDPHRAHAAPSLRHLVHLKAPGFDAIGATEPAVPGIAIGHNGTIAFGLTIFGADQEDVYVYETSSEEPDLYRYGDGWEAMAAVQEPFAVRGEAEQRLTLHFTRHGPVVYQDRQANRAFAIRSVWFERGGAPYLASLSGMRADGLDAFRAAMRQWGTPSVNQVYADTSGTIAWLAVGLTPVRPNWNGLLPVPGDGRYEWQGFVEPESMPISINPAKGFLATANEMNLPDDWPHAKRQIGYEWVDRSRAARIHEFLAKDVQHDVAASRALQTDVLSVPARRLGRLAARLKPNDADAARGLALLADWDHRLTADSNAAALFEVWWTKHLKPTLFARLAPDPRVRALLPPGDTETILGVLEHPDSRLGPQPPVARDNLLMATLSAAVRDCTARMGKATRWNWGSLHHGYFEHPLSNLAIAAEGAECDVGPLPIGGSGATPMHAGYRPDDFRVIAGASVRLVMDVGDWDNCVCINAPGQAGDWRSPHYRDLASRWADGEYVPMLYSAEAIAREARSRLILQPEQEQP